MVGWKRRSAALRRERGPAGRFMRCGALRSLRRLVSAGMPRGSPGEMKRVVRTRPVHQPGARQGQYGDPAKGVEGEFPARVACGCVTNPGLPSGSYPRFSRLFGRSSKRFANKTWRSGIFRGSRAAPFPGFSDYSDDRPNDLLTDLARGWRSSWINSPRNIATIAWRKLEAYSETLIFSRAPKSRAIPGFIRNGLGGSAS